MDDRHLPEPFRGGQGHPDHQVEAEGSLLALVIAIALCGIVGTGIVMLVVKLWSVVTLRVGG